MAGGRLLLRSDAGSTNIALQAIASGVTTWIGGGTGPSAGTSATTCTTSPFYMRHMLAATDEIPMNFAFTGKVLSRCHERRCWLSALQGNDSGTAALEDIVKAGAAGLKLHEVGLAVDSGSSTHDDYVGLGLDSSSHLQLP